jgi:NAD(P)-dependent dehydrogenase (short-subunit alcohol dehydrogenase family)
MPVAVLTGAGSGIGRAVAIALAARNFDLVIAGRRQDALEETLRLCGVPDERHIVAVPTDVRSEQSVNNLFGTANRRLGRIDVLFNNAGLFGPAAPVDQLSITQWNEVVETNLTGAFLCARAAFRAMKKQSPRGGRIINNGSLSAHVPRANATAYTATKHAITGLTRALSLEGRDHSIACGQIDIGNARTELIAMVTGAAKGAAEPTIDVELVAEAVVYMASLPLEANVQFMTVMATSMPFIGRG